MAMCWVVGDKHSALTAHSDLCPLEAERADVSNGSRMNAVVKCPYRLAGIFYHSKVVLLGNLHDSVHVAGKSTKMDQHDRFCFWRDERFDLAGVNAQCIRKNVRENTLCVHIRERMRCGNVGHDRRQDHHMLLL